MRYFCIDTSNGASISVVDFDGKSLNVLAEENMFESQMHSEYLGSMLESVLKKLSVERVDQLGIDRVVCGVGPAPFTGLRSGLVTARVLGFTCGEKVLGVCSLDVLALQGFDFYKGSMDKEISQIFVATDARRKEIYYGLYEPNGENDVKLIGEVGVEKPELVSKYIAENAEILPKNIGLGCVKYNEFFKRRLKLQCM